MTVYTEFRLARENHDRFYRSFRQPNSCQRLLYRSDMPVVLSKGVRELVLLPTWKYLRPLPISFASENPSRHVLGFHHEYPEHRHEYVVNLRRSVNRWQRHVVMPPVYR